MKQPAAFRGSYSDWRLVKTRGVVQVIFEVPLADSDAAYDVLGGMPDNSKERWFGIAAIKSTAEEARTPRQSPPDAPTGGAKRMDWRDMQPAAQAGIRCADPVFWAFLQEVKLYPDIVDAVLAAAAVRHICKVHSRSEFSTDHRKRVLWHQLDSEFSAWLAKERIGA